jgi:hypothetical protein
VSFESLDPFKDIRIYRLQSDKPGAEAFCVQCDQDRPLKVEQFPGSLSLSCRVCRRQQMIADKSLRPR